MIHLVLIVTSNITYNSVPNKFQVKRSNRTEHPSIDSFRLDRTAIVTYLYSLYKYIGILILLISYYLYLNTDIFFFHYN